MRLVSSVWALVTPAAVTNHTLHAGETDDTLVIWGGEFGRTPTSEGARKPGRDHNWHGFSMWLAGAGVKGGQAVGLTERDWLRGYRRPAPRV